MKRFVGTARYGAGVAFVGFIAAAIGSIYSAEIKLAFPFRGIARLIHPSTLDFRTLIAPEFGIAWFFWGLAFFWLYLFTIQESVKNESIGELQKQSAQLGFQVGTLGTNVSSIVSAADSIKGTVESVQQENLKITEAVNTLPPQDFVNHFCHAATRIHTSVIKDVPRNAISGASRPNYDKIIRLLLSTVASLAKLYDFRRNARYAANVMVFEKRRAIPPYFPGHSESEILKFLPNGFGLENLAGILYLPKTLSALSSNVLSSAVEQDHGIEDLIFGIPDDNLAENNSSWSLMPGGPLAFQKWEKSRKQGKPCKDLREAVHGLDDVEKFRSVVGGQEVNGDKFQLEESLIRKVEAYYLQTAAGQHVKSFQSFPLVDSDGIAIGVLNIHCNQTTFLGAGSEAEAGARQRTFAGVISTLVFEIANIVELWIGENYANRGL